MKIKNLITLIVLLTVNVSVSAQCAMCRATAETYSDQTDGGTSIADGLFNGIIYLIIVSYTILFFMFRKRIIKFFKELNSMER